MISPHRLGLESLQRLSGRRAFTLIELLVVISIVMLLIAILMPALANARDLAKTTACLSNVRSLGTAAMMYGADFRSSTTPIVQPSQGDFNYSPPLSEGRVMGTNRWAYWADAIYPYLRNDPVYGCPTGALRLGVVKSPWGYGITPFVYPVSTAGARLNRNLYRIDDFRKPSDKVYFADSGYDTNGTARHHWSPYFAAFRDSSTDNRSAPGTRHNSPRSRQDVINVGPTVNCGYNAVFFDGHASYMDFRLTYPKVFNSTVTRTYWLP